MRALAQRLHERGIEAVAVALHARLRQSGARAAHRRDPGRAAARGSTVTLSSEVWPEIREYERTSTAVANAYVQPLMASYLPARGGAGRARLPAADPLMTSGGSLTTLDTARRISDPPGGVRAGRRRHPGRPHRARARRAARAVVRHGRHHGQDLPDRRRRAAEGAAFEVDAQSRFLKGSGLPLRIPVIEMVEIGAGGGSIARVDALQRITRRARTAPAPSRAPPATAAAAPSRR